VGQLFQGFAGQINIIVKGDWQPVSHAKHIFESKKGVPMPQAMRDVLNP
jgi:hypothetical protein